MRGFGGASVGEGLEVRNLRGPIVGPVDLSVPAGRCAAICGPSGAGKSLFLRMIADLVPNEGEVRFGDLRRAEMPAPAWRKQVIYAGGLGWWADTVAAHVPEGSRHQAAQQCGRLGMDDAYLDRPVTTLSTGEVQRLTLVRALVRVPKILLLDEPTSALDADSTKRVEDLLRDALADGLTLLLVTHDLDSAGRLADERYHMAAGRLTPA